MRRLKRAWGVGRSLLTYYGQIWRNPGRREFYRQFIAPGALCFDIGAHVGDRVRTWRQLGARVVAVEPQPAFVSVLQRLYGHDRNVTVLPVGVAALPGRLQLRVSSTNPTVSTFSSEWIEEVQRDARFHPVSWDESVEVAVTTLDALIAAHGEPAFIKIDVEGLEPEVLRGLTRPVRALSFEFIPVATAAAQACVALVAALGDYEFRHSPVETMKWGDDRWLSAAQMTSVLDAQPLDGGSGDVYARLKSR